MFRILLAILISISPTLGYAQTSSKTLGGNYPSGFSGFRNYAKNPGGEIDAQNVSVAGTNGTINVFSNNPITNKKSFRVGGDLNTNITATFNFDTFDQGLADSSNNCAAALNLQPNGVGTYTINVKLGSTTVATKSFTTTSGLPVQYHTFVFSCGVLGQVPTIDVVANLTSGSGTDHYQADDFYMGQDPGFIQSMKISTDWAEYTPTYTGFGAVTVTTAQWKQEGSTLFIKGKFTTATTTAVEARISLPAGYTSAGTSVIPSIQLGNQVIANESTTSPVRYTLIEPNVSYVTIGSMPPSSTAAFTKLTGSGGYSAGTIINFTAQIPISGASNINATTSQCLQDGSCLNTFSAKVSSAGVVSGETVTSFISGNVTPASGTFTLPFGFTFGAAPTCLVGFADTTSGVVRVNSVSTTQVVVVTQNSSFSGTNLAFNITCNRADSDVKPVMQAPWVSGSVTTNETAPYRLEMVETTTTCSTATCTTSKQTSGVASLTRQSAGRYTVNFSPAYSVAPFCTCVALANSTCGTGTAFPTTTSWQLGTNLPTSNAATDNAPTIICYGAR